MRLRLAQVHQSGATVGQRPEWTADGWVPTDDTGSGTTAGVDMDATKVSQLPPDDAAVWLPAPAADFTVSTDPADRQIVLEGTEVWEDTALGEANVWYADGLFHMVYTAGWSFSSLGYATAEHPLGPWTKDPDNPFLGNGNGGESGQAARSHVFIDDDGEFYTYYAAPYPGSGNIDLEVATGAPPNVTRVGVALTHTGTATAIQNVCVVRDGSTYHMIFDSKASSGAFWQTGHATATNPLGPFTVATFPLTTLQIASGGMYGGPMLTRDEDGTWVLLYHAANVSGVTPTQLYRATSTDLTTWTQDASAPLVDIALNPPEVDQVGDPYYFVCDFGAFLYWEGVDNPAETGAIVAAQVSNGEPRWFDGSTWQTDWPGVGEVTEAELDAEEAARIAADAALTASIAALHNTGELLMQDGVTAPPVPIENEAQTDWLYEG